MKKSAISRLMSEFGQMPAAPGKKRGRPNAAHECPRCGATITRAQLDRKAPHACPAIRADKIAAKIENLDGIQTVPCNSPKRSA